MRLVCDPSGCGSACWSCWERQSLPAPGERGSVAAVGDPGDPILGYLDNPDPAAVVPRRPLIVSGWALDRAGLLDVVLVSIDGELWVRPQTGLRRPDVARAYPDIPGADRSGWRAELDLREWPRELIDIRVILLRADGTWRTEIRRQVRLGPTSRG
jgi:hypothetical protein